jgi:hypothetical protein
MPHYIKQLRGEHKANYLVKKRSYTDSSSKSTQTKGTGKEAAIVCELPKDACCSFKMLLRR